MHTTAAEGETGQISPELEWVGALIANARFMHCEAILRWINVEFIWELFSTESEKKCLAKIGPSYIFFFLSFLVFLFLFVRDICLLIEIFHFTERFRSCFRNTKRTPQKKGLWKKCCDSTNSWLRKYLIAPVGFFGNSCRHVSKSQSAPSDPRISIVQKNDLSLWKLTKEFHIKLSYDFINNWWLHS